MTVAVAVTVNGGRARPAAAMAKVIRPLEHGPGILAPFRGSEPAAAAPPAGPGGAAPALKLVKINAVLSAETGQ